MTELERLEAEWRAAFDALPFRPTSEAEAEEQEAWDRFQAAVEQHEKQRQLQRRRKMRSAMRLRHYCDFCKKSGARANAMRLHESSCTVNPNRQCRMCRLAGTVQLPIATAIELLVSGGVKAVKLAAGGECPACILSAIRQHRASLGALDREGWPGLEYDYKVQSKAFFDQINADRAESGFYNQL